MKLLVTGAGGGLGRAFLDVASDAHMVASFAHGELDIADADRVRDAVAPIAPHAILNFAAFTKVDACESDPTTSFLANAVGVENLVRAAAEAEAALVHVSTDYVFDGEKGSAYDEDDVPDPQSVYAESKLAGEEYARAYERSFIVRTGFVFGGGSDYLSGAAERLAAGEEVGGLADRVGSPTFVRHLAERIMPLVESERFGTYHLAGPEPTTWFDVLGRLKRIGDLPGTPVEQHAEELGLPAPRPRNSALVSKYADDAGVPPMPPLDQSLKEFLDARR